MKGCWLLVSFSCSWKKTSKLMTRLHFQHSNSFEMMQSNYSSNLSDLIQTHFVQIMNVYCKNIFMSNVERWKVPFNEANIHYLYNPVIDPCHLKSTKIRGGCVWGVCVHHDRHMKMTVYYVLNCPKCILNTAKKVIRN